MTKGQIEIEEFLNDTKNHENSHQEKVSSSSSSTTTSRDKWSNELEFLFSCISLSVGLGNVWRFPFIAYQNGGGAFLIPYLIALLVIGRPIYYLEICIGQFTSRSCVKAFKFAPIMKGICFMENTKNKTIIV